jgi:hypothetical protein
MIDENSKATLEYDGNGKATLTIRDCNGTVVYNEEVDSGDCKDLWGDFNFEAEHYKFNLFDDPSDYGVGCWIYPNGDEAHEITVDVEIYEDGKLARKNQ